MDSQREPLPPIVDERLIEAPFEVAVLGQTYAPSESEHSADPASASSSREARRLERSALKQARREAKLQTKLQTKLDAKNAKRAMTSPVTATVASPDSMAPQARNLSFDDLIDGSKE